MKATGFTKRIDPLGRIVIPKDIRATLGIATNDPLQFYVDGDAIVMKKADDHCCVCGSNENLTEIKDKYICEECRKLASK